MDDEPAVNRRDAVAGVSLLGALLAAVVGTIGYRMIEGAADPAGPTFASQPPPVIRELAPRGTIDEAVQPASAVMADDDSENAAMRTPVAQPAADDLFGENSPPEPESPAVTPTFVAPRQRAD